MKKNKQKTEKIVSKQESKRIKVKNNNQKISKQICEFKKINNIYNNRPGKRRSNKV